MNHNKYLNEEKYQKSTKVISLIALMILLIGLCLGGLLIYNGIAKPGSSKVAELEKTLEAKRVELIDSGVTYNRFARYSDGTAYDLKIITEALDPSFDNCAFSEYKNNSITKEYCSAKNMTGDFASTSSIMLGAFICIATCMIAGSIYMFSKRRQMLAYSMQQVMPVVKEGMGEIAPSLGNVAEEITKGVKKGFNDK